MYQLAIEKIKKSIFPIFYLTTDGHNTTIGVLGTGFFIDNNGHFLTALHVITDAPANSTLQYRGNIPDHIVNPPEVITEIYRDPTRDIFLGKLNIANTTPVVTVFDRPKTGKSICLCGYPLAQLSINPDGSINVNAVRQYWQPTYIIDAVTVAENGKNYIGFMTQDTSLNGMSGGPAFDTDGVIHGVITAVFPREILIKDRPSMQVFNGIALDNASIADVYDKLIIR
jgi:S1-C subfamily serine protease